MTTPPDMSDGASTTPPAAARPAPARRRARWLLLAIVAGAVLALPGLVGWTVSTEAGTAWLLQRLPGVEVVRPRGALFGTQLAAERVHIVWAGGAGHVDIDGLDLRGLRWNFFTAPGTLAQGSADSLHARRVQVSLPPSSGTPPVLPTSLRSPVSLAVAAVAIDELRIDGTEPVQGLQGALQLGADGGRQHRLSGLRFDWDRLSASDGTLAIDTAAPFDGKARIQAHARRGPAWQATLSAAGPLARIDLQGALRGLAVGDRAAPQVDARLQLQPFQAWPLGPLELTTHELDLSTLSSRLPSTRLDGHASLRTESSHAPLNAEIVLDNGLPGRWDQARLPIRRVQASLRADRARPGRIELPAFELVMADASGDAGRWQGQALLDGRTATLDSRLRDLRPQRLDARAAAMRLSGPLTLSVQGLPIGLPAGTPASWDSASAEFKARMDGTLDRSPQPVSLQLEGRATTRRIELGTIRAAAGAATAQGSARLLIEPGQRWQLTSQGRLDRFDPLPWVPGPEGSAWRRGPHRINASWTLDLALPDRALRLPPLQWLQTLQGDGELTLADSRLAGVPVQGRLHLSRDPAAPAAQRSHAQGRFELGRNVLTLDGRGDPASRGDGDRWQLALNAPAMAELAPLFALRPDVAEWAPRKGALDAQVQAQGRWPELRTDGEVNAQGLQLGELAIGRAHAGWRMETAATQSIDLQVDLAQLAFGPRRVETLRGQVRGTLASHRLAGELTAPLRPPELLERALGLRSGSGTQLRFEGDGGWTAEAAGGGSWRGRLQRLSAGVCTGTPCEGADASWLDTTDLQAELRIGADGQLVSLVAPAGRATLAGGIGLRWSALQWRAGPGRPELALQAEIDPFAVAPIMQRLADSRRGGAGAAGGPGTQWGGDLRLAARLDLQLGERVDAELQLRRHDGDLSVQDGATPQFLGLSDVDFTLAAHDGEWRFTPRFVGRTLGTISGAITARTTPQARWPDARATLDGAVGVQVPNLAVWAGWLPPGWRIAGTMTTTARLSGTLGAPAYTGELRAGGVGLRNLLQGVALQDGELLVALNGDTAQIERLSIRGGEGTLSATGRALFGAHSQLTLDAKADRFRVLGRVDRQLVLSGQAALQLQPERLRLDGKLVVDSGLFDLSARDAPGLDDDVNVRREGPATAVRPEAAPVSPVLRGAAVALDVDLGHRLRLRGRGLDTLLGGQLRLSAPGGRLAVNGTVRAEDGTYAAYGQKLEIERGLVAFAGPLDGARLDILALRPNLDARVGVAITGTALNPRVRLYSEPDMSETDKLSWLVLGRGPDGLGRTDTALLQRAAVALLSGEGEGPTDGLIRAIGLDDISLRQTDGEVRETVISLGKQLSRRWYVGYERGVNATTGTWQLIYRIAQRFTLRAQSGLENSLDLIWTWRFGGP